MNSFLPNSPPWTTSPEQQIRIVKQFLKQYAIDRNGNRLPNFTDADIPTKPEYWQPKTPSEILLLAVYLPHYRQTLDAWWDFYQPQHTTHQREYQKLCLESQERPSDKISPFQLPTQAKYYRAGIRWLAYDYAAHRKLSPEQAEQTQLQREGILAGTEVLMAMCLFPKYVPAWDGRAVPYPWLSGLQCIDFTTDPYLLYSLCVDHVLCTDHKDKPLHQIILAVKPSNYALAHRSSPVVRELLAGTRAIIRARDSLRSQAPVLKKAIA
jgi:hypothetical protein